MKIEDIHTAGPDALAPVLLATIQRLGQLGRDCAFALAALVDDDDADFDEAAEWITDISLGKLKD